MQEVKKLPCDIHVYIVDASRGFDAVLENRLFAFLEDAARTRALEKKTGRGEAIVADVLRQYALYDAFGILPCDQKTARTREGKPYLTNHRDIFFNYSHSAGVVLCAVARREIGADIQKIKPYHEALAEKLFPEAVEIRHLCDTEKATWFCRRWTEKEAAAKLYGTGLFKPHENEGYYYTDTFQNHILTLAWF